MITKEQLDEIETAAIRGLYLAILKAIVIGFIAFFIAGIVIYFQYQLTPGTAGNMFEYTVKAIYWTFTKGIGEDGTPALIGCFVTVITLVSQIAKVIYRKETAINKTLVEQEQDIIPLQFS